MKTAECRTQQMLDEELTPALAISKGANHKATQQTFAYLRTIERAASFTSHPHARYHPNFRGSSRLNAQGRLFRGSTPPTKCALHRFAHRSRPSPLILSAPLPDYS